MWLALLQAGLLASYGSAAAALFLVACVEPEGDGRLAEIANWLFDAPERLLRACVGARRGARCAAYLCDEPNPVLQLLYLLLVGGGYGLAVADMYPRVPCAALGPHHRPAALALVLFCLGTWAKACAAPPGYVVDAATFAKHDNYAYDGCLYEAGGTCPTTGVPKPARAKFCRTTRRVVARFDHFCPWVNNAVGEENYRWFLLFLASHALLLAYGADPSFRAHVYDDTPMVFAIQQCRDLRTVLTLLRWWLEQHSELSPMDFRRQVSDLILACEQSHSRSVLRGSSNYDTVSGCGFSQPRCSRPRTRSAGSLDGGPESRQQKIRGRTRRAD